MMNFNSPSVPIKAVKKDISKQCNILQSILDSSQYCIENIFSGVEHSHVKKQYATNQLQFVQFHTIT